MKETEHTMGEVTPAWSSRTDVSQRGVDVRRVAGRGYLHIWQECTVHVPMRRGLARCAAVCRPGALLQLLLYLWVRLLADSAGKLATVSQIG